MITFEQANKFFGSTQALKDVDLTLSKGKIIGLFGPNGAGKSTLLKAAAGLVRLTEGKIRVEGKPPRKMREVLAYLPEQNTLPQYWTLERAAGFYRAFFADWSEELYERQRAFLNLKGDMSFDKVSKGQQAKAKLLLTLARRAKYLLLDEPFSGIDLLAREEIIKALIRDYSQGEQTIIISTHEIDEIENLVEEIVFIDNGQVAVLGDTDELRHRKGMSISAIMKEAFRHGNK